MLRLHRAHDAGGGTQHRAFEQTGGHGAGPAFEQLQGFGAGIGLGDEIGAGGLHQHIHQACEGLGLAPRQAAEDFVIGAAFALDHVGGDSPRRAREADQGGVGGKRGAHAFDRFHHRRKLGRVVAQRRDARRITDGLQPRAFAFREPQFLSQRMGHQENVGKENGGIQIVAAHWLQSDFHRQFGVEAEGHEVLGIGAQRPVFWQIAARLAHQPHGRRRHRLTLQDLKQLFHHPRFSRL